MPIPKMRIISIMHYQKMESDIIIHDRKIDILNLPVDIVIHRG